MEMPIECFWPSITLLNFHSQYFTLRTIDSYFKTLPIFLFVNKSFAWYFDLTAKIPEPINRTDQIFTPQKKMVPSFHRLITHFNHLHFIPTL